MKETDQMLGQARMSLVSMSLVMTYSAPVRLPHQLVECAELPLKLSISRLLGANPRPVSALLCTTRSTGSGRIGNWKPAQPPDAYNPSVSHNSISWGKIYYG